MALTASKNLLEAYLPEAYRDDVPATDSTQYFRGGLVGIDAATGKLIKCTQAGPAVRAVYVCEDEILTGASSTEQIGVRNGQFKFLNGDSIVDADRGKPAFIGAAGDDTVFKAGTIAADQVVGTIERVEGAGSIGGAGVWVKVRGTHEYTQVLAAANTSGGS
jgi:hypothetical protein